MAATDGNPWQGWWADWSRLARDAVGGAAAGTAPRGDLLGELARAYTAFGKGILALATHAAPADLNEALAKVLEGYARDGGVGEVDASLRDFFSAAPAQLSAALAALGDNGFERQATTTLLAWTAELLALPAVGPLRDWQAAVQSLAQAWTEQQRAAATVGRHYQAALRDGYARFAATLRDEEGPPIETLAALYDAWVDAAEAAYGAIVRRSEFARDFAAWIDAGSLARSRANGLRERVAASLDLPQRAEINALLERQRALDAELTRLRQALGRADDTRRAAPVPAATSETQAAPVALRKPVTARVRAAKRAPANRAPVAGGTKPKARGRSRGEFDISDILSAKE